MLPLLVAPRMKLLAWDSHNNRHGCWPMLHTQVHASLYLHRVNGSSWGFIAPHLKAAFTVCVVHMP
jgi:hypothetical protein